MERNQEEAKDIFLRVKSRIEIKKDKLSSNIDQMAMLFAGIVIGILGNIFADSLFEKKIIDSDLALKASGVALFFFLIVVYILYMMNTRKLRSMEKDEKFYEDIYSEYLKNDNQYGKHAE